MAENKLTDRKVSTVKAIEKELNLGDGAGLWLRVRSKKTGGAKTFYYRYKFGGKPKRLTIGRYPVITLAMARAKKLEFSQILIDGRDPAHFSLSGGGDTVSQLFDAWEKAVLFDHADRGVKIRTHFEFDVLPYIGGQVAKTVEYDQIIDVIERIVSRGAKAKASKVLSWLRSMWGFGVRRRIVTADPTMHLRAKDFGAKESIRERNLSFDEIKVLGEKYKRGGLPVRVEASMWVLLATGCRTVELRLALVEHVDLKKKEWFLPKTKNGRSHLIHLSDFSMHWFKRLIDVSENGFILPGVTSEKPVGDSYLRKIIGERVSSVNRSKPTKYFGTLMLSGGKWTPHDLRRSMASRMGDLKIEPHVIEACLNHMPENLKRVYQHQQYIDERREAFRVWGDYLHQVCPTSRD